MQTYYVNITADANHLTVHTTRAAAQAHSKIGPIWEIDAPTAESAREYAETDHNLYMVDGDIWEMFGDGSEPTYQERLRLERLDVPQDDKHTPERYDAIIAAYESVKHNPVGSDAFNSIRAYRELVLWDFFPLLVYGEDAKVPGVDDRPDPNIY